jgi:hypothetical protein
MFLFYLVSAIKPTALYGFMKLLFRVSVPSVLYQHV